MPCVLPGTWVLITLLFSCPLWAGESLHTTRAALLLEGLAEQIGGGGDVLASTCGLGEGQACPARAGPMTL